MYLYLFKINHVWWWKRFSASVIQQYIRIQLTSLTALGKSHISTLAVLKTRIHACQNWARLNEFNNVAELDAYSFKRLFLQQRNGYGKYHTQRQKHCFWMCKHVSLEWNTFLRRSEQLSRDVICICKGRHRCYFSHVQIIETVTS